MTDAKPRRGQPPKPPELVRQSLTVRLPPDVRAWVDAQPGSASRYIEGLIRADRERRGD
jgi:hypothetical protein